MTLVKKKYGLWTATAMVAGIVIGSGVFFKADDVLAKSNGNLLVGLLAWVVGAMAMVFGALVFAEIATKVEKANGIVDYTELAYGRKAGYLMGWFKGIMYYFPLTAVLAWVSALYTSILFGIAPFSVFHWVMAVVFILLTFLLNYISPVLSGKYQVSTMVIKLIPLTLIAVVGIVAGLFNGVTVDNMVEAGSAFASSLGTFPTAVVATAFAYEGWVVATTINNEIVDSKKNLPKALLLGSIIVFVVYVTYYLGLAGVLETAQIQSLGDEAVTTVATQLFGSVGGTLLTVFVIVSCLGTLNGLAIGAIRTPFSLAIRNQGPKPQLLKKFNKELGVPTNSLLFALVFVLLYVVVWLGSFNGWWFGKFVDISELPIVLIYFVYIFIYVWYMRTFTELGWVKRFLFPILATVGSLIIVYGGASKDSAVLDLVISVVMFSLGLLFFKKDAQDDPKFLDVENTK